MALIDELINLRSVLSDSVLLRELELLDSTKTEQSDSVHGTQQSVIDESEEHGTMDDMARSRELAQSTLESTMGSTQRSLMGSTMVGDTVVVKPCGTLSVRSRLPHRIKICEASRGILNKLDNQWHVYEPWAANAGGQFSPSMSQSIRSLGTKLQLFRNSQVQAGGLRIQSEFTEARQ